MTEEEKMLAGKLYDPSDPKLDTRRLLAHRLSMEYNNTLETDAEKRKAILAQLLPDCGEDTFLQGPLQFDYGCYTRFGKRCYANFNLVVLDVCPVTFGDDVFIGPNCSFVSPMHALLPEERNLKQRPDGSYYDLEYGKPITVGSNCWFGSNVTVCGGVTIGEGCVIGAGSVVTKDIPPHSLAVGNPCRVLRKLRKRTACSIKESLHKARLHANIIIIGIWENLRTSHRKDDSYGSDSIDKGKFSGRSDAGGQAGADRLLCRLVRSVPDGFADRGRDRRRTQ